MTGSVDPKSNELFFSPRRALGRTGFHATRIGIGDLADRQVPLETCVATLRRALNFGLNVVDTAPSYEEGYSERIVGEALRRNREGVFLIDKIDELSAPVRPQAEQSLERLGSSQVDLFVFHGLSDPAKCAQMLGPGGAWEELEACRAAGLCRFVGVSSHHPDVLIQVLRSGRADVVMFPLGPFVNSRYLEEVLPLTRELGVGSICFKTFGAGKLLGDTEGYGRPLSPRPRGKLSSGGQTVSQETELPRLSVEECVRYTLTLDPDVALLGMSFPNEQDAALQAARDFQPLSASELREIRNRAELAMRGKGECWWNPR